MASYHCSVRILSRSAGRSSVQFAAYITAEKMKDERLGQTFSHVSKEEVCYSEMLFSERVPEKLKSPEKFWNEVEAQEKNVNSQIARTWEIALPHELTIEQNQELAKEFAQSLLDDGMPAVQFAVHQKEGNWHAHIMAPTRDYKNGKWQPKEKKAYALDADGKKIPLLDKQGNQKYRERKGKGRELLWLRQTVQANKWNERAMLEAWRERFADQQNAALQRNGYSIRVDHRSYKEQGIEKIPQIHEGYAARRMEHEGRASERCQHNRDVSEMNSMLERITAQIQILKLVKDKKQEHEGAEINERRERETVDASGRTSDGERTAEAENSRSERLTKILERRERETADGSGRTGAGEREIKAAPADYRAADPDSPEARAAADRAERARKLLERREREAAEARRAREAAAERQQQAKKIREQSKNRVRQRDTRNRRTEGRGR